MLVYIILGIANSGRRQIVADLIHNGLESQKNAILLPEDEKACLHSVELLKPYPHFVWHLNDNGISNAALPTDIDTVFFFLNGYSNPIIVLEALPAWLASQQATLGRIISVVDIAAVAKHPQIAEWYEACLHFSDVALLTKSQALLAKWMQAYIEGFKKACFPCFFLSAANFTIANPALVLDPSARRISQVFDLPDTAALEFPELAEDEEDDEEAQEMVLDVEDPYFARQPNGEFKKPVPDIRPFIDALHSENSG